MQSLRTVILTFLIAWRFPLNIPISSIKICYHLYNVKETHVFHVTKAATITIVYWQNNATNESSLSPSCCTNIVIRLHSRVCASLASKPLITCHLLGCSKLALSSCRGSQALLANLGSDVTGSATWEKLSAVWDEGTALLSETGKFKINTDYT